MLNLFNFIALRHLKLKPGRTALAIGGIVCGIALFVAISLINESTNGYFRESMGAVSGKATLIVSSGESGFDEAVAEKLESIPGILAAVPIVESRTWTTATNESVMVMGVDLFQEKAIRSYKSEGKAIIGDAMSFISQPDSIIITDPFAKTHQLNLNDKLELATTRGRATFTVRGILSPTGLAKAYGGALAIMDIDAARLAFSKEGKSDRLDIVTSPQADIELVAAKARELLGSNFTVERPEMASKQMEKMTESFQFMSRFFSTLALIVSIFLIANSVSISVAERRREIGTLRALGTKRIGVLAMFVSEAAAMGAVGAFIGAFVGRGLAGFLVNAVTHSMTTQFAQKVDAAELKFTGMTVLTAVLIGVGSSVVAAFLPALKATQVEPIDAMKRKDTGETKNASLFQRRGPVLGLVLLGAAASTSCAPLARALIMLLPSNAYPTLQILLQFGAIVGIALIGPELVIQSIRFIRPLIIAQDEMISRLAIDNVLRNPKRTAANVTSLMVGLILVVMIACVNTSFKGTLLAFFDRILHADLIVSTTGRLQSHETQPLHESIKTKLDAHPGVLGAYELREVKFNYEGQKLLLKYFGEPPVPETAEAKRYPIFDTRDRDSEEAGRELFHSKDLTVMVSENFALRYKKKTGETITLSTPKGEKSFRIVATVAEYANPVGTLYLSKTTYRSLFDDALVSGFAIKLKKGFSPTDVRTDLDRELSKEHKLTILLNSDIRSQVESVIDSSFAYTRALEIAALLVALLGLMNTLLVTVMERTRELGLSRAIGMTRAQITRMILLEAASQGSLGAMIAAVLGLGLGFFWVTRNLTSVLGWIVDFYVPWNSIASTLFLGLLVTLLAAWYPARRAARLDIVDALNHT